MREGVADERVRGGGIRVALGVLGVVLTTVLVLTGVLSLLGGAAGQPRNRLIGTKISAFAVLPGVNRGAVRAPWLSHHPAVLLFFADWCVPCHAELPMLARSLGLGRIGRTVVVGIDGDHSPSVALAFVTSSGVRFAVAQDADQSVASTLVPAFPAAVFVTSTGIIAAVHYGVISAAELRATSARLR
jgi:thiol-disulfide isomerase/thioredoxin